MERAWLPLVMLGALVSGCGEDVSPPYTLYRNSPLGADMRIHFATFDAKERGIGAEKYDYNRGNCQLAADLLTENVRRENNGRLPARYWCEFGLYREK